MLLAVIHGLMVLAGAVITVRHLLTLRAARVAAQPVIPAPRPAAA
jgi:hypothetical protein